MMKKIKKGYKKWVLIDIKHCPRKKRKIKKKIWSMLISDYVQRKRNK